MLMAVKPPAKVYSFDELAEMLSYSPAIYQGVDECIDALVGRGMRPVHVMETLVEDTEVRASRTSDDIVNEFLAEMLKVRIRAHEIREQRLWLAPIHQLMRIPNMDDPHPLDEAMEWPFD